MIIVKMSVRRLRSFRSSSSRSRVAENPPKLGGRRSLSESRKLAEVGWVRPGLAVLCWVVLGWMDISGPFRRQADEGVLERMRGDL
jgi:hypothetical protein